MHPDDPIAPYSMSAKQYKANLMAYYKSTGAKNAEKEWVSNPVFRDEVLKEYRSENGGENTRSKSTRKRRAARSKV